MAKTKATGKKKVLHKWKWDPRLNGGGTCERCGLRCKIVKLPRVRVDRYGDRFVNKAMYTLPNSDVASEKMPACSAPGQTLCPQCNGTGYIEG